MRSLKHLTTLAFAALTIVACSADLRAVDSCFALADAVCNNSKDRCGMTMSVDDCRRAIYQNLWEGPDGVGASCGIVGVRSCLDGIDTAPCGTSTSTDTCELTDSNGDATGHYATITLGDAVTFP